MNEQLKLLIETQDLDTRIIAKQKQIQQIPLRISSMERPLAEARKTIEARKKKFEATEKKKRDRESTVDEISERIEKLKERTPLIKTNVEYQALLKEIETAEKEKYTAEDEILEMMELVDKESIELKGAEAALGGQEKRAEELKRELQAEVKEAEQGIDELRGRRTTLTSGIDSETYDLYMSLLEDKDGLAVVETRAEVCQGCNMNIMPQLFVELKKGEEIIQCPQCRRILYPPNEEPSE